MGLPPNLTRLLAAFLTWLLLTSGAAAQSTPPAPSPEVLNTYFAAVLQDDQSSVIALALRGVDLNARNADQTPALTLALQRGSLKVADFLLTLRSVDIQARNAQDETPLMIAAIKGHLAQVQRLIERGAQVNKTGWTPLHYACASPQPASADIVRLLLEHHAYVDAESPNGTTPLMMAAHYGSLAAVNLLLQAGADPQLKNEQDLSAMDFANRAQRAEAAEAIASVIRAQQPKGRW